MSFPVLFSSQLAAIMEALLKAVVLEVTALVEDGAAELRLELRERDREIGDNHREIQGKDREIQKLQAALELLKAREEAAVSPVRSGGMEKQEQTESCAWTKEEEDSPDLTPTVKCEPTEEFTTTSSTIEPHLDSGDHDMYSQVYQSYDDQLNPANEETDDSSHWFGQEASVTSPQNTGEDLHFDPQQAGFSLPPIDVNILNKNNKRTRAFNTRQSNTESGPNAGFRCDQCGKCFTERRRLMTHQSVHTGEKPFSCRKCGQRFTRQDSCMRHERSSKLCEKEMGRKPQVKKKDPPHLSVDSSGIEATVECEQTDEMPTTSATIEPHLDLVHNEMYSHVHQSYNAQISTTIEETEVSLPWFEQEASYTAPIQNNEERLTLDDPQQAGLSLLAPIEHVPGNVRKRNNKRTKPVNTNSQNNTETGPNPNFICDQCGKCFTERRRLMTHQSVHTGEKPFSCRKCGQRFTRQDSCSRHEQSRRGCV